MIMMVIKKIVNPNNKPTFYNVAYALKCAIY